MSESSRPSSQSLFIPPASSPLIRQLQTLLMPPHNERAAAISMGLSVVLCSVNNAAAVSGLQRVIHVANAALGLAVLNEVLSLNRGKLCQAPNSLQDPPPQVEQIECN